jgi:hypothetical protein
MATGWNRGRLHGARVERTGRRAVGVVPASVVWLSPPSVSPVGWTGPRPVGSPGRDGPMGAFQCEQGRVVAPRGDRNGDAVDHRETAVDHRETKSQSTTESWATRLAIAPERNVVSRAAVVTTSSASRASGEWGKLVIATVVAPASWASSGAVIVSSEAPVWEMPTATSSGPSREAEVTLTFGSSQAKTAYPMRCSFCRRSSATKPLAPTPSRRHAGRR